MILGESAIILAELVAFRRGDRTVVAIFHKLFHTMDYLVVDLETVPLIPALTEP